MSIAVDSRRKVNLSNENGIRRVVWVPTDMDRMIENTRKKLGLNRSAFFKYAVNRLLEKLSVLTETVHKEKVHRVESQ